jgi:homogentisate 1,2-dioxygenase
MPVYHKLGLSQKRHTQFENQKEVLLRTTFGTEGFSGNSVVIPCSPTHTKEILKSYSVEPKIAIGKKKSLLLKGFDLKAEDDFLDSRKALLVNKDCTIGLAAPQKSLGLFL